MRIPDIPLVHQRHQVHLVGGANRLEEVKVAFPGAHISQIVVEGNVHESGPFPGLERQRELRRLLIIVGIRVFIRFLVIIRILVVIRFRIVVSGILVITGLSFFPVNGPSPVIPTRFFPVGFRSFVLPSFVIRFIDGIIEGIGDECVHQSGRYAY